MSRLAEPLCPRLISPSGRLSCWPRPRSPTAPGRPGRRSGARRPSVARPAWRPVTLGASFTSTPEQPTPIGVPRTDVEPLRNPARRIGRAVAGPVVPGRRRQRGAAGVRSAVRRVCQVRGAVQGGVSGRCGPIGATADQLAVGASRLLGIGGRLTWPVDGHVSRPGRRRPSAPAPVLGRPPFFVGGSGRRRGRRGSWRAGLVWRSPRLSVYASWGLWAIRSAPMGGLRLGGSCAWPVGLLRRHLPDLGRRAAPGQVKRESGEVVRSRAGWRACGLWVGRLRLALGQ